MDNIKFKKIWQDGNLIELKISATSEFVLAYQNCYVEDKKLEEISKKIIRYVQDYEKNCYLELGVKKGNYTPAFSMELLPTDIFGHVKIEVDIEVADNDTRSHRCCFYVASELGLIEEFGKSLKKLIVEPEGVEVTLC